MEALIYPCCIHEAQTLMKRKDRFSPVLLRVTKVNLKLQFRCGYPEAFRVCAEGNPIMQLTVSPSWRTGHQLLGSYLL